MQNKWKIKQILLFAGAIMLLTTSGCVVRERATYAHYHGHERHFHGRSEVIIAPPPVIVPGPPRIIVP
jgi:hypothetical protein